MSKNKNQKKNKQTKGSILATVSLILVGVLVLGMVGWMILDESGAIAEVNGCNVQVVAVGVIYTSKHFANHQAFKTAFYGLYLFDTTCLKTY